MADQRHRLASRQRVLDDGFRNRAFGKVPERPMPARVEDPVERCDIDIRKFLSRSQLRLRLAVFLVAFGRRGLCIGLVGLGIERRLAACGTGQRDLVSGVLENVIGSSELFEPEARLVACVAKLVVARQDHQDFHEFRPFGRKLGAARISGASPSKLPSRASVSLGRVEDLNARPDGQSAAPANRRSTACASSTRSAGTKA